MAPEMVALINPMSPPPTNPFLAVLFYVLLTPVGFILYLLDQGFRNFGPTNAVGAFGLAIIALTLIIRGALFPLFRWQIGTQWKIQADQRRLGPELKELQQKYKKDRQRLNEETMALYRRHGLSPFSQLSGCLPLLIQMPFIYALYLVIEKLSKGLHGHAASFLWISNLNDVALKVKGGIVGDPLLLVVPILAGILTYMQSKMMMQPARPDMSESERQMYRVMSQTTYLMPVMIAFFALNFYQGIGLYWITQSLVMVLQVFTMMGWGGLKVPSWVPGAGWYPANSPRAKLAAEFGELPRGGGPGDAGASGGTLARRPRKPEQPSGGAAVRRPSAGTSRSGRPARRVGRR